jgi:peptide/nickel transport system substrate-binding protein
VASDARATTGAPDGREPRRWEFCQDLATRSGGGDPMTCSRREGGRGRLLRLSAAFVVVVATIVGATGAVASTVRHAPDQKRGGSLTFGLEAETTNYCLSSAQLAISGIQVVAAVYDTLTVPNAKGDAVPYLAKSLEPNDDFTEWTITLRDGVTFHDGTPLDAAALKLNMDSWRGAPGAPNIGPLLPFVFQNVTDVQAVDPMTVKVVLDTPVADFDMGLYGVGRFGIMAPAQLNAGEECATKMIGTGPFELEEYKQNEATTVVRNPDYWQKGYPKLDSIRFVPVVDGAARVTQLQGGELDLMHTSAALQIDALQGLGDQVKLLEQKPGFREVRYYDLLSDTPPFDNPDARTAFAMAIDRTKNNQIRNKSLFEVANGLMDRSAPGYVKNAGYPKYDPKKASQLVEKVKAATGSFDVILGTTTDPENSAEAQLVKEELGDVGINAQIAQFDQATLINKALARDIDVLFWRNLHGGFRSQNNADTYVWFANKDTGNILNFSGFNDETTQSLLERGRGESNLSDVKKTYQDFNRAMAKALYLLPAWYVDWTIGYQPDVKLTFPPLPDGGGTPLFVYGRIPVLGLRAG